MASGFEALHLRRFRDHPGRLLLSLAGIAVGSLLVVTVLCLFGSLTGSVASLSRLAGGADVEVAGTTDAGVDQSVLASVASTAGVATATPLVRTSVAVEGVDTLLVGADPTTVGSSSMLTKACFASVRPTSGGAPPGPVVVVGNGLAHTLGVRAGATIQVSGGTGAVNATVAAVLDCAPARQLNRGVFVAATLPTAEVLAGRGPRLDSIFVTVRPGIRPASLIRELQATVGDRAVVSSPQLRVRLAGKALRPFQQGLTLAVSLVFVVAGLLVFNTMSMTALERRRELATLRALGGRRRTLLAGFLAEAALLGLIGSALGTLGGIVVARAALSRVPPLFLGFLGVSPRFILPPLALPSGIALGTLAAVAAALFPGRAAVRVSPVEAMRPEGVLESGGGEGRTRPLVVAAGAGLLVGGTATTVLGGGSFAITGYVGIMLGTVIVTFGLRAKLAVAVGSLAGGLGATGRLAAAGIERAPRRVWATMLAVTVGVGIVVSLGGLVANQAETFAADFAPLTRTSLWVQTAAPDVISLEARLPMPLAGAIAGIPGVAAVSRDQAAYMTLGHEQVLFEGAEPGTNSPLYSRAGRSGRRVLAGAGLIVTKAWASRHHLRVGDRVGLPTPGGLHVERIATIVDLPVPVQGELGVDFNRFTNWFGRSSVTSIEVMVRPGADVATVKRAIGAVVGHSPLKVRIYSGNQVWAGSRRSLSQITAIFNAMVWAVVAATALAVLNTMAISVVERRRELGILRAVGTSRKTIRRMVVVEAVAITAAGLLLGTGLGLVQHWAGVQATATLTGFTVRYRFVLLPLVTAAVASVVMALAGSIGPAWRASHAEVIAAIGYE